MDQERMHPTKLTLEMQGAVYSIQVPAWDVGAAEMFSQLVRPLLLAAGFSEETISTYIEAP